MRDIVKFRNVIVEENEYDPRNIIVQELKIQASLICASIAQASKMQASVHPTSVQPSSLLEHPYMPIETLPIIVFVA